jgi:hypothetical protein
MATIEIQPIEAQAIADALMAKDRSDWAYTVVAVGVFNKLVQAFPPPPQTADAAPAAPVVDNTASG